MISLGAVCLVFCEALLLAQGKAQGWAFYLRTSEVAFEVLVRLTAASLIGILLGTLVTAITALFLWRFKESRERIADRVRTAAIVMVVFVCSRYVLEVMLKWSYHWGAHRAIYDKAVMILFYFVFAVALMMPRRRKVITTALDGILAEKVTRRAAIATVAATAGLVAAEFVLSRRLPLLTQPSVSDLPKRNFLVITFDALSAEDMSLYGYKLQTTPNIDSYARKSTVFQSFYAASTFTTPTIATILTGLYPCDTRVFQLNGRISAQNAQGSLPHQLRVAGYSTAAFFSNPLAYYVAKSMEQEFNVLPEPVFRQGIQDHSWDLSRPLHQDSGVGSRLDEYWDLEELLNLPFGLPTNMALRFRPTASFEHATRMLGQLPDGFFLWIHVMAPHDPYLPDAEEENKFIPQNELLRFPKDGRRWEPTYAPDQQHLVNRRRLAYDEYIATADRTFGAFMNEFEKSGRQNATTVIISADHGESFDGGVYRHQSPYLTRPTIHIPLIVRMPGQQAGTTVSVLADQTSFAPTVLELAGLQKPDSMQGPSLAPYLNGSNADESGGRAFCQYFERNSVFKPIRRGSIGVIEGQFQYVYYLAEQKGVLRPLNEAQIWDLDRSAQYPEQTAQLRHRLCDRFPDLVTS